MQHITHEDRSKPPTPISLSSSTEKTVDPQVTMVFNTNML